MKKISYILSITLLVSFAFINTACEDEDANPYVEPLSGVHAFAAFSEESSQSFIFGQPGTDITIDIQWVSIDRVLEVEKIDLYLLFNENFTDVDGNPQVARHGGSEGILFQTIEGGDLPANRTSTSFTVTQQQVFDLYQGSMYDYDGDGTEVDVFNNSFKPTRSQINRFIAGDDFSVRWELTTTDGQLFDSWSPSVCTEFPGANCEVTWSLICESDLAGTYTYTTTDMFSPYYGQSYAGPVEGEGELTEVSAGNYSITDVTFGFMSLVYGPEFGATPESAPKVIDACDVISISGLGQYDDVYHWNKLTISPDGKTMTVEWSNEYGDKGISVLTRTDDKVWPSTLVGT